MIRANALTLAAALLAACEGSGETNPYEEAVLVPVTREKRAELAGFLAEYAHRNGLYFRDSSHYITRTTDGSVTVHITLFRQLADGSEWSEIEAWANGESSPIVTFQDPPESAALASAEEVRGELISELEAEWEGTQRVPILPHGGIPHARDLVSTAGGLKISREEAAGYDLPANSPLLPPLETNDRWAC